MAATLLAAGTLDPRALPAEPQRRQSVSAPVQRYRVVRSYPHDPRAYTQGLFYSDGVLYEGTGLVGESSIRKVRLETGEVLQVRRVDPPYFGEGIALWQGSIVQLTWQSEVGFVYDKASFERTRTFTYSGEGWGLTHNGTHLVMSDGSAQLRFLDPKTFREVRRVTVRDGGAPVTQLNELEFIDGEVYANVWQSDRIARIAPDTGQVKAWIDLRGLLTPSEAAAAEVLNGIAYDADGKRLFVTGKLWPRLFHIELLPPAR
ncbi:MAG TPA: glutaminyl-peptide cyclotransferase [Vicinamibacterales bacterium]|nr:glutaminyl-peptide cyclotransferase [Vicinamibacterales bacterium]